jgi:hypothetical protein
MEANEEKNAQQHQSTRLDSATADSSRQQQPSSSSSSLFVAAVVAAVVAVRYYTEKIYVCRAEQSRADTFREFPSTYTCIDPVGRGLRPPARRGRSWRMVVLLYLYVRVRAVAAAADG